MPTDRETAKKKKKKKKQLERVCHLTIQTDTDDKTQKASL